MVLLPPVFVSAPNGAVLKRVAVSSKDGQDDGAGILHREGCKSIIRYACFGLIPDGIKASDFARISEFANTRNRSQRGNKITPQRFFWIKFRGHVVRFKLTFVRADSSF